MTQAFSCMLLMALFSSSHTFKAQPKDNLEVVVQGIDKKANTTIWVAVFSQEGFLKEPIQTKSTPATGETVSLMFNLPKGEYAASTYHDINNNGKLDKRIYGAPKEPYGFSNDITPGFGPPGYRDCMFRIEEGVKAIVINLIK